MSGVSLLKWSISMFAVLVLVCREGAAESTLVSVSGSVVIEPTSLEFFCESWSPPEGVVPTEVIQAGDFNGDGQRDLLGRSADGTVWAALLPGGSREAVQLLPSNASSGSPNPLAAVDVDGDHFDDVLMWDPETHCFSVAHGSPDGLKPFVSPPSWCLPGVNGHELLAGEFDGAGAPVLALTERSHGELRLQYLIPRRDASSIEIGPAHRYPSNLEHLLLADLNGDLRSDTLFIDPVESSIVAGLLGVGSTTWAALPTGVWGKPVIFDLNGDGRADLALSDARLGTSIIVRSTGVSGLDQPLRLNGCSGRILFGLDVGDSHREKLVVIDDRGRFFLAAPRFWAPKSPVDIVLHSGAPLRRADPSLFSADLPSGRVDAIYGAGSSYWFQFGGRLFIPGTRRFESIALVGSERLRNSSGMPLTVSGPAPLPQVCIGFNSGSDLIGPKWGRAIRCPKGYGMVETEDYSDSILNSPGRILQGLCCPLPVENVLTERREIVDHDCPDGFIMVGVSGEESRAIGAARYLCAEVDPARFVLGEKSAGQYWGVGWSMRRAGKSVRKEDLPREIQAGIGRVSFLSWDTDGCIGDPPGGLLVGLSRSGCSGYSFRELRTKTPEGSVALPLTPHCPADVEPFDPLIGCRGEP